MPNETGNDGNSRNWLPGRTAASVALEERESASALPEHAAAGRPCLAPVLTCALASVATV